MQPFGIISDQHFHSWSAFSTTNSDGVNSRLQYQLNELRRCADAVREAGGDTIFNAGDTFHTRGTLTPTVLNPVMDLHRDLIAEGFKLVILAGNHDIEQKNVARISSAVTALEGIGCRIVNTPVYDDANAMVMIPWIANITELKAAIEAIDPSDRAGCHLILHAPIDGVIPGLPDHGLDAVYLDSLGFKRVLSGHYHAHKEVVPGSVWSIGASTHQTWGDVGAKAGFLIVSGSGVKWHASHAPEFVEIDGTTAPEDVPLIADGNFVRVKINSSKSSDVESIREFLISSGARGVVVLPEVKAPVVTRAGGATLKAGATLDASIGDFIATQSYANAPALTTLCQEILTAVRSV